MKVEPYLFFEGRCDEAIAFYRRALDAELLGLVRHGDNPEPPPGGTVDPAKVMHAAPRVGETRLMLSDVLAGGAPHFEGVALSLAVADDATARRRFGVSWMMLTPKPM